MEITDIIGEGKLYEFPFSVKEMYSVRSYYIISSNQNSIIWGITNKTIADYICDLLNKEHCNG